ncbi:hypothetical protein ABIA39_005166 [Nocardia sp. GAS34]|nr:nuclear transport factor 2 family protein [Nocardia albiluteola]
MSMYDDAAQRYFTAWNATGAELADAVAKAWTEEGSYVDPLTDVRGHEQLTAAIAGVHEQFPGFVFRPLGAVDGHHDTARFSWELVAPDGTAPVAGSDVIELDEDGRIRAVLGFLDRVPA